MEELTGTVLGVVFRSEDRSRVVARVLTGAGGCATVTGPDRADSPLAKSLAFRFVGRWDDHPKFGRQFRFDAAVLGSPVGKAGMVAYLTSLVDRVGEKRAGRLWELYGDRAADVLRDDPGRVVADQVLGEGEAASASASLQQHRGRERVLLEMLTLVAGRGFGRKLPEEAVKLWGDRAGERVRRNPYLLLLHDLPGAGWKRCDKLWLDLGHSPTHPKRQVLAAVAYLEDGHGDTWHEAKKVAGAIAEACGPSADPKRSLRTAERWGKIAIRRKGDQRHVALAQNARAEEAVARKVKELLAWTAPNRATRGRPSA